MEGEWSCYRGGHLNGERMFMLQRWSHKRMENGHVTEVVFNGGRMVMLQYNGGKKGHLTEVASLME